MRTFSAEEAKLFTELLSVSFFRAGDWPFVIYEDQTRQTLAEVSDGADVLRHFSDIGILVAEPSHVELSKLSKLSATYGDLRLRFMSPPPPERTPNLGLRLLEKVVDIRFYTSIGKELSDIAEQKTSDGFLERLKDSLKSELGVTLEIGVESSD